MENSPNQNTLLNTDGSYATSTDVHFLSGLSGKEKWITF